MPLSRSSRSNRALPLDSKIFYEVAYHFKLITIFERGVPTDYLKALASHYLLTMEYVLAWESCLKITTPLTNKNIISELFGVITGDFMFSFFSKIDENRRGLAHLTSLTDKTVFKKFSQCFGDKITPSQLNMHVQYRHKFISTLKNIIVAQEQYNNLCMDCACCVHCAALHPSYKTDIQAWIMFTLVKTYFKRAFIRLYQEGNELDESDVRKLFKDSFKLKADIDSDEFLLASYMILKGKEIIVKMSVLDPSDQKSLATKGYINKTAPTLNGLSFFACATPTSKPSSVSVVSDLPCYYGSTP